MSKCNMCDAASEVEGNMVCSFFRKMVKAQQGWAEELYEKCHAPKKEVVIYYHLYMVNYSACDTAPADHIDFKKVYDIVTELEWSNFLKKINGGNKKITHLETVSKKYQIDA